MNIKPGKVYRYKEKGGVNWSLCKIIAVHKGKVWLENLSTFSCPVGRVSKYEFVQVNSVEDLTSFN